MEVNSTMIVLKLHRYRIYNDKGILVGTGNAKEFVCTDIPADVVYEFDNWVDFSVHVEGLEFKSVENILNALRYSLAMYRNNSKVINGYEYRIEENFEVTDGNEIDPLVKEYKEESSTMFNPIYHAHIKSVEQNGDYWEIRDALGNLLKLVYADNKKDAVYQAYTGCKVYEGDEVKLFTPMKNVMVIHDVYRNLYLVVKESDMFSSYAHKCSPTKLKAEYKDAKRAENVKVKDTEGNVYSLFDDWIQSEIKVEEVVFEDIHDKIKAYGLISAKTLQSAAIETASLKYKVFSAYELKHRFNVFSDAIIMLPKGGSLV